MNKLISVVIPIYNVENYLKRCIDSVINNSYKNLEIILVDDGSTDNSSSICDSYIKKDSRIKVIHKENNGLSSARNTGIDIASGDYISFIDSDDFVYVDYFKYMYELSIKHDADIVNIFLLKTFKNDDIDLNNVFTKNKLSSNTNNYIEKIDVLTSNQALEKFHSYNYDYCLNSVVAINKLYKSNLFKNIRYPLGKLHEDEFTSYKIVNESDIIVFSNRQLYGYFQRENSIMNSNFTINRLDALEAYDNYIDFYKSKQMFDVSQKACRRYLNLLVRLKTLLLQSNLEKSQKTNINNILENKFKEIYNLSLNLIKNYNLNIDRIQETEDFYYKFNNINKEG